MNTTLNSITLTEWDLQGPENNAVLRRFLDVSPGIRELADRLGESKLLQLTELRHGLEVKSFSYVGRVRVGDLDFTILPKIKGASLLGLLRYAYGLRRLNLLSEATHPVDDFGFEDLLISQLNAEVRELVSRGLLRAYVSTSERLSSPRGRIDLTRLALDGGTLTATLPCRHHPRLENTLLNQVLIAGLRIASAMASIVDLRRESRRLVSQMEEQVSAIRLDRTVLDRASRRMNRLTTAYHPALSIVRMLVEAKGVVLEEQATKTTLPGFLFDMNAFFQALIYRFLCDNLPGRTVRDEHGIKGMLRFNPQFNPKRRQSPTPRPDYVVIQQGLIQSILDAKYRDLWEKPLPREMLYQLVVYAISHQQRPESCILYPTLDGRAREARIEVTDPMYGRTLGRVCLRPVELSRIETFIEDKTTQGRLERESYAHWLAFGE